MPLIILFNYFLMKKKLIKRKDDKKDGMYYNIITS